MQLRIWDQGKVGQVGVILVSRVNGDGLSAGSLEREPLTSGRNTGDRLQLCLELADGPCWRDAAFGLGELRNDDEGNVGHGGGEWTRVVK